MKDSIKKYQGELEIDYRRGVIYFHLRKKQEMEKMNLVTLLRVCRVKNLKEDEFIDIISS